jgi:hypothetical protein
MLIVRSFRSTWHDVTRVTICRIEAKRLDGLNSRTIRPIPAALEMWNRQIGLQVHWVG